MFSPPDGSPPGVQEKMAAGAATGDLLCSGNEGSVFLFKLQASECSSCTPEPSRRTAVVYGLASHVRNI